MPLASESWLEQAAAEAWQTAQAEIQIARDQKSWRDTPPRLSFRGNNAAIFEWVESSQRPAEFVLEGPAQTGKTYAALKFMDALARTYPKARGAIVRQVHADLAATVIDIFNKHFVSASDDIRKFGGENVEFYEYPNGTRIWTAGMDRPGKVLSGGLDFVYVNQAEELIRLS